MRVQRRAAFGGTFVIEFGGRVETVHISAIQAEQLRWALNELAEDAELEGVEASGDPSAGLSVLPWPAAGLR